MNKQPRRGSTSFSGGSIGWLFATLLFLFVMLLLTDNVVTIRPPSDVLKATPIPLTTPTRPSPHLDLNPCVFAVNVDTIGLLSDKQSAIVDLQQQVHAQPCLLGRIAGLVTVYGGAPDANHIDTALQIANKVVSALKDLGTQNFVFTRAVYHNSLFILNGNPNVIKIEIYLFAQ